MKSTRVATIAKNRLEELRISLTEFHGHDLVDIRVFALPYAGRGSNTRNGSYCRPSSKPSTALNAARAVIHPSAISKPSTALSAAVTAAFHSLMYTVCISIAYTGRLC